MMPDFDTYIKRAVHNATRQVNPDFPQHLAAIQFSSRATGEEVLDSRALGELTVAVFTYRFVVGSNIPLFLYPVVKTHVLCAKMYHALFRTHWIFLHEDDSPDLMYLFLGVMRLHSEIESRAATWLSEVWGPLIEAVVSGYTHYLCKADELQILRREKKDEDRIGELQKVAGLLCQITPLTTYERRSSRSSPVLNDPLRIFENDTVSEQQAHAQPEQPSQDIVQQVLSAVTLASEVDVAAEEEIETAVRLRDCPRPQANNEPKSLPVVCSKRHTGLFRQSPLEHDTTSKRSAKYSLAGTSSVHMSKACSQLSASVKPTSSTRTIFDDLPHRLLRGTDLCYPSAIHHALGDYKLHRPLTQGNKAESRKARIYASSRA
ncbi:hypothetical protein R3P38DRAFT_3260299 [Favolaschia claudopus]|uniref:Uncharacterized protein n=1 Tax=Favolaschia claudopus TaxID=2862362 RepID=A0AAW0CTC6_9AGAR